jgi:hypothetical protein
MVPDVGDPAVSLMMNSRLICRATLQIVESNKAHIGGFRGIADFRRLGGGRRHTNEQSDYGNRKSVHDITFNYVSPCNCHHYLQSQVHLAATEFYHDAADLSDLHSQCPLWANSGHRTFSR